MDRVLDGRCMSKVDLIVHLAMKLVSVLIVVAYYSMVLTCNWESTSNCAHYWYREINGQTWLTYFAWFPVVTSGVLLMEFLSIHSNQFFAAIIFNTSRATLALAFIFTDGKVSEWPLMPCWLLIEVVVTLMSVAVLIVIVIERANIDEFDDHMSDGSDHQL